MEKPLKLLCISILLCAIFIGLLSGGLMISYWRINDQQRQIDELKPVAVAFVQSQHVVSDGKCGIKMDTDYDVFYIDYDQELVVSSQKEKLARTNIQSSVKFFQTRSQTLAKTATSAGKSAAS